MKMKTSKQITDIPVAFYPNFLFPTEINDWFLNSQSLVWTRGEINMYGKKIPVPREESLFGENLKYTYRGEIIKAEPWPDFLLEARNRIHKLSGFTFSFSVGN